MSPHWLDSIAERVVDSPLRRIIDARACEATTACSAIPDLLSIPTLIALAKDTHPGPIAHPRRVRSRYALVILIHR